MIVFLWCWCWVVDDEDEELASGGDGDETFFCGRLPFVVVVVETVEVEGVDGERKGGSCEWGLECDNEGGPPWADSKFPIPSRDPLRLPTTDLWLVVDWLSFN